MYLFTQNVLTGKFVWVTVLWQVVWLCGVTECSISWLVAHLLQQL